MKKNILNLVLVATIIVAGFLTACSSSSGSQAMNNNEDMTSIYAEAEKAFGDKAIYKIMMSSDDELSSNFERMTVYYAEGDKGYYQILDKDTGLGDPSKDNGFSKNRNKTRSFEEFKIDNPAQKFADAVQFIEENTDEYEGFQLASWSSYSYAKRIESDFTINATKVGEGTSREGRNIVTTYYDFDFDVKEDGSVEYND